MGTSHAGWPGLVPSVLGVEMGGSALVFPVHPPLPRGAPPQPPRARPSWGGWGCYLLLVQRQVQERPPTQRPHVPWLHAQHGVEVEHGCPLLAQEPVAAGAGKQGLSRLTPWRRKVR